MADAPLLALDRLSAVFVPGKSALGHHWILKDGDEREVGRTKLVYEGAGKTVGRFLRATGMSTRPTTHAAVLARDGRELFQLHSRSGQDPRVDLTDPAGALIGAARRRDLSLELLGPDLESVLGKIARASEEDVAFPVEAASGQRLGALTKEKVQVRAGSFGVWDLVELLPNVTAHSSLESTMHLGFAESREYHLVFEHRPVSEPLQTLVAAAPLLAAYAY